MPALSNLVQAPHSLMFTSQLFGELEVAADQLVRMPEGLFGFPACTQFALLPAGHEGFFWLQSTQEPSVAFLIVDPFLYFDGYTVDLAGPVLQRLETTEPSHVNVYAIVTLPNGKGDATANLQGPLVFNVISRQGFQAVIQDSEFGTRERVPRATLSAH
jgi:flagellar assembly factor FliW